jgi:hypothetical protein
MLGKEQMYALSNRMPQAGVGPRGELSGAPPLPRGPMPPKVGPTSTGRMPAGGGFTGGRPRRLPVQPPPPIFDPRQGNGRALQFEQGNNPSRGQNPIFDEWNWSSTGGWK